MHTATRLFLRLVDRVRAAEPAARICAATDCTRRSTRRCCGRPGSRRVIGGEFEQGLVDLARRLSAGQEFVTEHAGLAGAAAVLVPDRTGLPPLGAYARLVTGDGTRRVGYTEASRGCKTSVPPLPGGAGVPAGPFRIVQPDVVLEDIRRQVAAGAEHITFGDPGFFQRPGPRHADCGGAAPRMAGR